MCVRVSGLSLSGSQQRTEYQVFFICSKDETITDKSFLKGLGPAQRGRPGWCGAATRSGYLGASGNFSSWGWAWDAAQRAGLTSR